MNVKSRSIGLLAAAALSFTMFGGAMAQSDSENVSTVLTGDATLCAIDIYSVGGGLGSWEFDGSAYVEVSGSGSTQYFYGDLYNIPAEGCDVSVTFGGLVGPGGLIGTENFSAIAYVVGPVDPAAHGASNVSPYYDFEYTLNSVPVLAAGTYGGTIVATVENGV
jgi:hypothetical protein